MRLLLAFFITCFSVPFATAATQTSGDELWARRYHGGSIDASYSVATDGARVYVTGQSFGSGETADYATVAYDAATGVRLWVSRYDGPGNDYDQAGSVATDGERVYVTGDSADSRTYWDYATVAYDAGTGAELWASRYNGPGGGSDYGHSVATDGTRVYVTGSSLLTSPAALTTSPSHTMPPLGPSSGSASTRARADATTWLKPSSPTGPGCT